MKEKKYDHKKIEKKWQTYWAKKKLYEAPNNSRKKKFYGLIEFPYPSGDGLHVGHVRSNTAMDIIARKRRMQGYNVLYPIGWDAFGLPTENYAIKTGKDPRVVTKKNTDTFRRQLQSLGFSFDWSREINTTDPAYYKWTQWIFLQLFKKGLAYKAKTTVNWCPKDKTVLANEEVIDGKCERCGTTTNKREKEQWMLAITKYADRLDKDLDDVDFIAPVKLQQRNWIGRNKGALITFPLNVPGQKDGAHTVEIFTTRPDTIFGATFIAVAPELAYKWMQVGWNAEKEVKDYVRTEMSLRAQDDFVDETREKTGVFTGVHAMNPANKEKIPVYVVNYVLGHVGTGAIMGVPAHDERDHAFAQKYELPIKQVIEPVLTQATEPGKFKEGEPMEDKESVIVLVKHWNEDKYIGLRWKTVAWGTLLTGGVEEGESPLETVDREIREETGYTNFTIVKNLGVVHSKFYHVPKQKNYFGHSHAIVVKLNDGAQKEIGDEEKSKHEIKWLTLGELTKFLTAISHIEVVSMFTKDVYTGGGVLTNSGNFNGMDNEKAKGEIVRFVGGKEKTTYKLRDWVFSRQRYWGEPIPIIRCEKCGYVPVPEKDLPLTLPKVKNYHPTDNGESPLALVDSWVKVKCPSCKGPAKRETDTMPNWAGSSWYFLRYADPKNKKEFASKKSLAYFNPVDWYNGGMEHTTLHLLYSRFWHKFLYDLKLVVTKEPYKKRTSHGLILAEGGVKMSKSKGNVINPDVIVKSDGADTLRIYEMFMGPFDQAIAWDTKSIVGSRRFLERVFRLSYKVSSKPIPKNKVNKSLLSLMNQTIEKIGENIEEMKFNTAISQCMIFLNECEKEEVVPRQVFENFLLLLAPFAPHITEELWSSLGYKTSIHVAPWPKANKSDIVNEMVKIAVQVNGKVRAILEISPNDSEEAVKNLALQNQDVMKWMNGQNPKKVLYIKGKIVSIVL